MKTCASVLCLCLASLGVAVEIPLPSGAKILDAGPGKNLPTLEAALTRVADLRKTDTASPVVVRLAPGDYVPEGPVDITRKHSATNWGELVVCAADFSRKPRLFGGVRVVNWTKTEFNGFPNVWCADVSGLKLPRNVRLAFYNGRRLQPARWPNLDSERPYTTGFAFADVRGFAPTGKRFSSTGLFEDEIQIRPGDRRGWAHPEDAWVIAFPRHNWWNRAFAIRSVSNDVVKVDAPHKEITDRLFPWDRWCVENMAEELDVPGEWYLDPRAQKLYLLTPDGSDPNGATVTLERGREILRIGASNVSVIGLELTAASAGVRVDHADDVKLLGCSIHDIGFHGGNGVWIMGHRVRMADCDVFNIGGHGVFVQSYPKENRVDDRLEVVVENNYVHHTGQVNSHGIGIWITGQGVRASHNLIHDTPRCGMFGYGRFCELSYNRIRHTNTINDDTGAIYGGGWTGGIGSRVCYNWISDSIGFQRQRDGSYRLYKGACGVYPDEGCGGLSVYGNLIESCHHVAMHLHNGRWITISNNVFVSNGALPTGPSSAQLSLQSWNSQTNGYFVHDRRAAISNEYHRLVDRDPRWLQYPALAQAPDNETAFSSDGTTMMGVQVKNNIVYYPDQGEGMMLRAGRLNMATNAFDNNVYWPGQSTNVTMQAGQKGGHDWTAWRATGADAHSVIADPLFVDAAKHDYRLKPDSPARKLGFVDLPYDQMGLQRSRYRPELPREAEGVREHPEWLMPRPGFLGPIGRKVDTFLAERIFSGEAKGRIYDETVNAFRTHYDDDFESPQREGWARGRKGLWQGEYWGKTMLSAAVVAEWRGSPALKAWLKDAASSFVKEFQQPDGYLCTYRDRNFVGGPDGSGVYGKEIFCWNLWGRKYTMWALIELARTTNSPEFLQAAAKMMDQEIAQLKATGTKLENTGYFVGLPSMSVLKPLLVLYRATGKPEYLAFAKDIVAAWERAGNPAPNLIANAFTEKPVHAWYEKPSWWAKAYEMMSCLEGLIDYSRQMGDTRILDAVKRIVAKLEENELNAVYSVGYFDHFTHAAACVNATTEPCDITHWIRVNRDLFHATDDPHYLENIELAFHNGFLAGVYRDGIWGAHSVRSHGTRHRTAPHQVGMKYHQCCIDNMPRTFVDVAETAVTRGPDDVLSVNLYAPLHTVCGPTVVDIGGNYPFGGTATVRISSSRAERVRFRIPPNVDAVTVDGQRVKGPWYETSVLAGERSFSVAFARRPRIIPFRGVAEADPRASGFETAYETAEMKGRARTTPGVRVQYGPLLLAKSLNAGTAKDAIFKDVLGDGTGWKASLKPATPLRTDGAWKLTLTKKGAEPVVLDVGDFATAADADDPGNAFSIWF